MEARWWATVEQFELLTAPRSTNASLRADEEGRRDAPDWAVLKNNKGMWPFKSQQPRTAAAPHITSAHHLYAYGLGCCFPRADRQQAPQAKPTHACSMRLERSAVRQYRN
jgi:hypothetical protein